MAFQIKDFSSIVASMINHARAVTTKVTDFQPGSVVRTIMEAPAVEVEALYLQMFLGLRDAIPVATFRSFGFDRLPAATAHGFVTVSRSTPMVADLVVAAGTAFTTTDGRVYASTAAVTWASGSTFVRIPVACSTIGSAGNVAAGGITSSASFSATDGYVVSNALISTGRDEESDTEREVRFADYVQSISRGTVLACLTGARSSVVLDADGNIYEYVARAGLVEIPGRIYIYLYSSRGLASDELVAGAAEILEGSRDSLTGTITPGIRPAGVRVDVLKMEERVVPFVVGVELASGYSLSASLIQSMRDVYDSLLISVMPGETLYLGTLVEALLAVPGVLRVVPSASSNIVCGENEALIPGTFSASLL